MEDYNQDSSHGYARGSDGDVGTVQRRVRELEELNKSMREENKVSGRRRINSLLCAAKSTPFSLRFVTAARGIVFDSGTRPSTCHGQPEPEPRHRQSHRYALPFRLRNH
eukprot:542542-Rhodomonas_salina.1